MPTWDPQQYLRHADHRTRPGLELLARIDVDEPDVVVDLGCGPGHLTAELARRWPGATTIGLDSSADMIDAARAKYPELTFDVADAATWEPDDGVDVVFCNAVLHWLPDHAVLFPRLASFLGPGGWLAVQMPANFGEPTHSLLRDLVAQPRFSAAASVLQHDIVQPAAAYIDLLSDQLPGLDVWETTYHQLLDGPDPVLSWTRGSALRPVLDALEDQTAAEFEADYARGLRDAYPARPDGRTVLAFRRLFMVGRSVISTTRPGTEPTS